jgi:hypothetical protein
MPETLTRKEILDNALRDYIAETTDGAILTDYFTVAASTELDDIGTGRTVYLFITPPAQPAHVSMGLISYAHTNGSPEEAEDDE